jgi:hypothetical protein
LKEETALRILFTATRTGLRLSVPNMDHIKVWLADGIGKGTISAAVSPILTKKADMASLAYCDAVVREKHAKLQAVPSLEPVPLTDDDWRGAAKRFKENRSLWSRHAGPEPGMAGCRCPAQVLVDALIDPSTGFDIGSSWHFITEGTVEMAAFVHDAQNPQGPPAQGSTNWKSTASRIAASTARSRCPLATTKRPENGSNHRGSARTQHESWDGTKAQQTVPARGVEKVSHAA